MHAGALGVCLPCSAGSVLRAMGPQHSAPSTGSGECQGWVVDLDVSLQDPRDCRGPRMAMGREGGLTSGHGRGLQVSVSIPSPNSSLALADLELELRDSIVAKHGDKVPYVYFNKGL